MESVVKEDGYTLSSPLFEDLWSRAPMRRKFSDLDMVGGWVRVEVALARAQAAVGLIPAQAAKTIEEAGRTHVFDMVAMRHGVTATLHQLMPFINQFRDACPNDAGQYLHWGATTQDIIDTGAMLRSKEAMSMILEGLTTLEAALAVVCEREAETVMAGRTHGQQALPITFGFKVANWLSEVRRGIDRLKAMSERVFVVSIVGAVGTSAYMGPKGLEVAQKVAADLELGWDPVSWQAARDRIGEMLSGMILLGSSLGRIGHELAALQKTELSEVHEPHGPEQVGSSTMPQKRNPSIAEGVLSAGLMLRAQAGLAMELMATEHERDDSRWQIDSRIVPEVFLLLDGQIGNLTYLVEGLEVDRARMRANIVAEVAGEPMMRALASFLGRHNAHDVLHECFMLAHEKRVPILDVLSANESVSAHLGKEQLQALMDPSSYLGVAVDVARNEARRAR
ncbi:MAG: class-II fumarase/aspartase family protein [Mesorhizobium sp.]